MNRTERQMNEGVDFDDRDERGPACPWCGYEMEQRECYECHGEGEQCKACDNKGFYWICPNVRYKGAAK